MIRLVEDLASPAAKPKVLVLSTFAAEPVRGGGARRLRGVAASLQIANEVTILALTNAIAPDCVERRTLPDGVTQVSVGRSAAHLKADSQMAALVGLPVDDIGCSVLHQATAAWGEVLQRELTSADTVVLAHPYLATSLPDSPEATVVYDGHNVEIDLKQALLDGLPGHRRLLAWVRSAEQRAVGLADVMTAVSEEDAASFRAQYDTPELVIAPNGVDHALLPDPSAAERDQARAELLADLGLDTKDRRPIAIFVASNHPPNHRAADALAVMAEAHTELIVVLAGAHSERERPGVHNYGRFDDASYRRLLLGADVALNTVDEGSGTNLKLIEALAVGTPVLATRTGARGLGQPDDFVAIVTDETQLSDAIKQVLNDIATERRVAAGRRLAATRGWVAATADLEAALVKH